MDSTALTTSSQTHLLLLLLLSATIAAMSDSADQQQPTTAAQTTLPGCPDKCGNVSIPYPFGTTKDCFLPGFQVICNDTFDPPRAFFVANLTFGNRDKPHILIKHFSYSMNEKNMPYRLINSSLLPVELTGVSVSEGKARVQAAFSFDCRLDKGYHAVREQEINFPYRSPFLLSETSNVLMGIGTVVEAEQTTGPGCQSYLNPVAVPSVEPVNGSCSGQGCCQAKVPPSRSGATVTIKQQQFDDFENKCTYAMIVEKSWYNFSSPDLYGDAFLRRNAARGVPLVVDFHIADDYCPRAGQPALKDYACKSGNSTCVDLPKTYSVIGYFCRCWDGYEGNPYIPGGCQDIDECERPDLYPCHGKCQNKQGSYECTCPLGTRGNATEGRCTDLFPLPAKVSLGAIGGLFVIALLVFLILLRKEKRKMREFFIKNGGPTLENAKFIKIYKREDLKPILKSSNFIGKGAFGEVYKGHLDNQQVAVKKPINVTQNEQFANEVIIQSQVIHKNIVRLIGCCLEVDIPMLVYEFLSKGSLDEILHGSSRVPLDLDRRLNIAAESAEGLAYMHSKTGSKILHGDVKPANILLDDSFVPKISDFGISRLISIDKQHTNYVIGDKNYMDPVYLQTGLLTDKSDVYSFGVVLLELISRKKATYSDNSSLVKNFLDAHKKNESAELFDKDIAVQKDLELLDSLVGIAVECLNLDVEQRPEMTDVAERLLMLKRSWYK